MIPFRLCLHIERSWETELERLQNSIWGLEGGRGWTQGRCQGWADVSLRAWLAIPLLRVWCSPSMPGPGGPMGPGVQVLLDLCPVALNGTCSITQGGNWWGRRRGRGEGPSSRGCGLSCLWWASAQSLSTYSGALSAFSGSPWPVCHTSPPVPSWTEYYPVYFVWSFPPSWSFLSLSLSSSSVLFI